jgi:UDP-glucose 4-epimerase
MSRALVTGGAGFIGSHLVDALVVRGDEVVVLDDLSSGSLENLEAASDRGKVHVIEASVLDEEALADAVGGCDRVYHLAVRGVRASLGAPVENHDVNATGTLLALEAARRARVGRFLYCSSSEVYGNTSTGLLSEATTVPRPATVYGGAKLVGEHYALAYSEVYGLQTTVVRPFNSYGPREHDTGVLAEVIPRFVARVRNGLPPVVFGSGQAARDFTYVTETAKGILAAADSDRTIGKTLNLAYGTAKTVLEVAHAVLEVCGRTDLAPEHVDGRPGDVLHLHADTTLARDLLGFSAEIEFADGLRRYVDWVTEQVPDPLVQLESDVVNWSLPGQS